MTALQKSEIKQYNGRPAIFIDGTPYSPVIYALTDCPGGRLSYEEVPGSSIQGFVEMGFLLFQLDIWLDDMWKEDGTFDISMAKSQIRGVTDRNPKAKVFLRFHTTPPKWWNLKNPDELVSFADQPSTPEKDLPGIQRYLIQDLDTVYRHSFASEKWLGDSSDMLVRFLKELSKEPEASALAGIQPATGVYGEHHYWAFMNHEPDTGACMTKAFRRYLQNKYNTDEALKKAWSNPDIEFKIAQVPDLKARLTTSDGIFRNPLKEKNIIDYYDCQHRIVAESVVHFCKLIKDTWPVPIITGAFYGYYVSVFGRSAAGGHLSEQTILTSKYIDCLCGPQGYDKNLRNLGGSGSSRGMLESAFIHGKLWLDEMDQPDHTGTVMGGMPVYPPYESKQILRRNSLFPIMNGAGLWYYDFGPHNYSGWWTHPEYRKEIEILKNIIDSKMNEPYRNPAEVLLVFDTEVFKYTAVNSRLDPFTDAACINHALPMAQRSGAAIDTIYLSDIENIDPERYKCIVFMNSFVLNENQRNFIKGSLNKNNRHIVWLYAPGYISPDSISTDNICSLIDMQVEKITIKGVPAISFGKLSYDMNLIYERLYKTPSDYPAVDLFVDKKTGRPSLMQKEYENHTVWYSPVPFTTPEIFTHLFQKSGVHIFCDAGDSVCAGSGLLTIHTENGGYREITLPNSKKIKTDLTPAETLVIDLGTGEILIRG